MKKTREIYERRSEILTKKLLSKLYSMEADILESRMKAGKNIDKVNEQINDWQQQLKDISNEREKLNKLYQDMVAASENKWNEASRAFEEYAEKVSAEKQDFYERAQGWLNDLGTWITDLEERARNSSENLRSQALNQVDNLKKQQNHMRQRISDMQKSTGESWEKFTSGIKQDVNTMKSTINNVYKHFLPSGKSEKNTSEEGT
jgi:uncharacterized protein involved in exopolysaccharide biosynthesis